MKTCPRCRSEYLDDALFCAECGASLVATPTASATPAATLSDAVPSSAPLAASLAETTALPATPSALLSEAPFISAEQPAAAPSQAIYGNPPELPILIENNTPFTKQTLKDFYKNLKILSFLSFIFAAISLSIYFFGPPFLRMTVILGMASIFVVCGILFIFFCNAYVKRNTLITDSTYVVYQCDERYIHCYNFDGAKKESETHIEYEKISQACQNKKYIMIHIGAGVRIIRLINRATFTIGTEEEFKDLLRAKCGPKIARFPKK